MNITQTCVWHNTRRALLNNYSYFLANNEMPYWRSRGKFRQGKAGFVEIIILTELVSLKYDLADDNAVVELKNCFAYFWERFRINKLQMQRASCRLHQADIVTRSFRETLVQGGYISKELDLKLNKAEVC